METLLERSCCFLTIISASRKKIKKPLLTCFSFFFFSLVLISESANQTVLDSILGNKLQLYVLF